MSELRYPNESGEYRQARDALLEDEQELVDKVKSMAEKRRKLPLGGELKEHYVFQWANDGKLGKNVKFSELFGDKSTLLLYLQPWRCAPKQTRPRRRGSWLRGANKTLGRPSELLCRDIPLWNAKRVDIET
jgi:predicted dithiol-disulfide oxidoreductase (DUF899 family)